MIELGLHRISRLLSSTALPWRGIHVAGTNGKGSICAYISSMLETYDRSPYRQAFRHAPLKHARFTSPHLVERWDCITLDQKPVAAEVFREVEGNVLERNRKESIGASEFEILTATAFEIFSLEGVDVGVVEVGMGGRLDATNIIGQVDERTQIPPDVSPGTFRPPPLMTAISSIGLDHQAFLGNTLEAIAREKAGIIKPRVPVVLAPNDDTVMNVLEEVAHANRSPIYHSLASAPAEKTPASPRSLPSLTSYLIAHHTPRPLPTHSHQNALTAFTTTLLALQRLGRLPIDTARLLAPSTSNHPPPPVIDMFQAPFHTTFPGRLQQISLSPLTPGKTTTVLLDGAHNAQSAFALAAEIARLRYRDHGGPVTFVLAASDSKPAEEILRPLLRDGDTVFTVEFGPVDGMPWVRPQSSTALERAARAVVRDGGSLDVREYGADIGSALRAASEAAGAGGPMVVAGSLYLVGDVLRLLRDTPPTLEKNRTK